VAVGVDIVLTGPEAQIVIAAEETVQVFGLRD